MFLSHTYQKSPWSGPRWAVSVVLFVPFAGLLLSLLAVTFILVILTCLSLPILLSSMASDGSREPQEVLLLA